MWSTANPTRSSLSHVEFLRRHARRLLRAAHADASRALPVLRRIKAAGVVPAHTLTELFAARESVRLKHVLNMLATELGYADWAACKRDVDARASAELDALRFDAGCFADFATNWFPDHTTARAWQSVHGGYLVRYGTQTVAILHAGV
ncbi:hypothetical protein GWC77_00325 [Paraburkholderia sp. NMBU_R16]|uniref:hypothetical protein n=1 Tax=Paraburkholderia sp. NMBU_R16 TaxID=2698676 RepID=UPI001567B6BF|nr:hypothetical protein [Paraburkholderia sp. NMBU_R16]NRO94386.1 hypothetical protein [Paraburkholderia sp. NMBU_R16]